MSVVGGSEEEEVVVVLEEGLLELRRPEILKMALSFPGPMAPRKLNAGLVAEGDGTWR